MIDTNYKNMVCFLGSGCYNLVKHTPLIFEYVYFCFYYFIKTDTLHLSNRGQLFEANG